MGKIKLGGFLGPTERVIFEYKFERPTAEGEVKSINMYKESDGDQLGKVEYVNNAGKIRLHAFNIMNWSINQYAQALLAKFLRLARKERVHLIEHEMYDTDDKTHNKLLLFKEHGFDVESRGNITGYNQYFLKLNL